MKLHSFFLRLTKGTILIAALAVTLLLDGLMYGFLNACPACSSFTQFITTPAAVSSGILASLTSLFSLTRK